MKQENFSLKNHTQNVVEKLFPDPFLKIKSEHISGSIVWSFIQFVFFVYQAECLQLPHIKLFWKTKWGLDLVFLSHFLLNFWRKIILSYSINWPDLFVWLSLLHEILANVHIVILCLPSCEVMNFEIKLIFLIKSFFQHDQNVNTKNLNILRMKELLTWN